MTPSYHPRVSIVIPTYNDSAFVSQAILSVRQQTYRDYELIVVDDGSTDNTRQMLAQHLGVIRYFYQDNAGESSARNRGIQEASGEYIAFLDADDLWLPDKLARQVELLDRNPAAVLTYCQCLLVDADGKQIFHHGSTIVGAGTPGLQQVFPQLVMEDLIATPSSVIVRKSCLTESGLFDPNVRLGEDWDLWLRLSLSGPFYFAPEPLACYRIRHPQRRLSIEAAPEYLLQSRQILENAFAAASSSHPEWQGLRNKALAALLIRTAMYNLELGSYPNAAAQLTEAIETDPQLARNTASLARRIAQEAYRIAEEARDPSPGYKFIQAASSCFPYGTVNRRRLYAQAQAEFFAIAAFSAYQRNNYRASLRNAAQAVRFQPTRLRDRGLVSRMIRALLGSAAHPTPTTRETTV